MANAFDLIIIGGGPAGYTAAIRATQLGLRVACIEKREALGGTCLNVGCIPSKALLDSSEHYYHAQTKMKKHGVNFENLRLDLAQMMKRKEDVVRTLTMGIASLFKSKRVERYFGKGKILGREGTTYNVEVTLQNGERSKISSKFLLLATGSEAIELPILKFDQKRILSSTEALSLSEVPSHLAVVGGGYIGLEMASVWRRLGAKVTVVEFMDSLLPMIDQQLARELHKSLVKQGIEFMLSTKCLGADAIKDGLKLRLEKKGGPTSELPCTHALVSTGRRPYTDGLGLETINIELDKGGRVVIDDSFKTSAPNVYAVGDIVSGPMLAHKAEEEGLAAVAIMAGGQAHVNYLTIPSVIYTWPELASVGLTEEELKDRAISYKSGTFPFLANGRARAMDETEGLVKVLSHSKTQKVLGVHIFGPRASDMVAEAVTLMEFGGTAAELAACCHGHPTLSEALKEAAMAVDGRQIHM